MNSVRGRVLWMCVVLRLAVVGQWGLRRGAGGDVLVRVGVCLRETLAQLQRKKPEEQSDEPQQWLHSATRRSRIAPHSYRTVSAKIFRLLPSIVLVLLLANNSLDFTLDYYPW